MAQKIVAGNWKMNLVAGEAVELIDGLNHSNLTEDVRVVVFPSDLFAGFIAHSIKANVEVGVQNFHPEPSGAYTGENSISQVKSVQCSIGLIGHSERRAYFNESNGFLKNKVDAALENDFDFIFCCGEPLIVREAGQELIFVRQQLEESLFHLTAEQMKNKIIAYEPVWAIGTGVTASSEQAESMHASIRSWLKEKYSEEIAASVSILYGGSCNPSNAKELFRCPNVDGGLIGGAALKSDSFSAIVNAF